MIKRGDRPRWQNMIDYFLTLIGWYKNWILLPLCLFLCKIINNSLIAFDFPLVMSWNSSTKHYQIQSPIPQTCLTTTNKTLSINDVVFSIYWLLGQKEVYWLYWQFTFAHVRELEIKGYVFTCLSVHTIIPWRCGHQLYNNVLLLSFEKCMCAEMNL